MTPDHEDLRPPDDTGARWRDSMAARSLAVRVRLGLALTLLVTLALIGYFTSTPTQSSAHTMAVLIHRAQHAIEPLDPERDAPRLRAMHLDAVSISTPECVSCHGVMVESRVAFHRIHLENPLLPRLECSDCHKRVDLRPDETAADVDWVDVSLCRKCHSQFPGLSQGSPMKPQDFYRDCTGCHTQDPSTYHTSHYLSPLIPADKCKGCHGGRVLPWDPLHEEHDWLDHHGSEALSKGSETCFACHDFGLKFCDTCHAEKPASHLPPDRWKTAHPAAARADTRACHTCHDVDYCKRCHLSHEDGWRDRHPAVVHERGSTGCTRCHSASFCGYCHTAVSSATEPARPEALTEP